MSLENMPEQWLPVVGFEGFYEVSSWGKVRSLPRVVDSGRGWDHSEHGGIRKQAMDSEGYMRINLAKDGKKFRFGIHRLVAIAFIPNPDNKPVVNHKEGKKHDNRAWMLEWNTVQENSKHAFDTGLMPMTHLIELSKTKKRHLNPRALGVRQLSLTGQIIKDWNCFLDATEALGISQGSISSYLSKKNPSLTMAGFRWQLIKNE